MLLLYKRLLLHKFSLKFTVDDISGRLRCAALCNRIYSSSAPINQFSISVSRHCVLMFIHRPKHLMFVIHTDVSLETMSYFVHFNLCMTVTMMVGGCMLCV